MADPGPAWSFSLETLVCGCAQLRRRRVARWAAQPARHRCRRTGSRPRQDRALRPLVQAVLARQPAAGSSSTKSHRSAGSSASRSARRTTVTGSVANTQWGPVQVALSLKGDTITNVTVLQYPSGNSNDVQINDNALPILTQETIGAQSARIDMVSGATVTSAGYLQSLQSALDQAGLSTP